jgi:hypothetical protein
MITNPLSRYYIMCSTRCQLFSAERDEFGVEEAISRSAERMRKQEAEENEQVVGVSAEQQAQAQHVALLAHQAVLEAAAQQVQAADPDAISQ